MLSRDALDAAVETYNRYRRPTAVATLLDRAGGTFRVRFEGPFVHTCCRDDYFEDLVYELGERGVDPDRVTVRRIERADEEAFVVTFAADAAVAAGLRDDAGIE